MKTFVSPVKELDPRQKSLLMFDDYVAKKNKYFMRDVQFL